MKPPLKFIEWEDAYNGNHEWCRMGVLKDKSPLIIRTVGFEVARSKKRVTLAMSYHDDGPEPAICDLFTIPVSCIRKERTLKC